MSFTHLHVHSHYSLLDGLIKIDDLIKRAKELGMESIALTDHGAIYGAVEFFQKAKKAGIKPIIGCEVYVASGDMADKTPGSHNKRFHLTLLVKNKIGYKNLVRLITQSHLEGFYYKPRVDKNLLRQHSEGLICLSGCRQAEIPNLLYSNQPEKAEEMVKKYQEIFGKNNFYIEIQSHFKQNDNKNFYGEVIELAKKNDISLVATNDTHYLYKDDEDYHDVLLAIGTGNKISDPNRLSVKGVDLSLKSEEEMSEFFKELPEAIINTQKVVDAIDFEFEFGKTQFPIFKLPDGETAENYLEKLAIEGLRKRFGYSSINEAPKELSDRFKFEIEVIKRTGFASYILIVWDIVNWAKNQGIAVGPGRGSAAGSFISYLIGITNLDPIKYTLLFERFLNLDRIAPPDIDLDFADHRRDEVLDYISQKYGRDHVAQIITFGTMAARAAIRDAGRALGLSYGFCDRIAKMVPFNPQGSDNTKSPLEKAIESVDELKQAIDTEPQARQLIQTAKKLEGVARHASTHACGVVIAKDPIVEYMPLQWAVKSGNKKDREEALVTQYDMRSVEALGLLKMDILGLRNLTTIEKTLGLIEQNYGEKINIDDIPLDSSEVFKMLQRADTIGVFQLESNGMRRYLKELKPTELEDIIVMVAAFRPGPMEFIPTYIARKNGKEKVAYLHPGLEPILKNTYGVAIYQEQVLRIANQLAGFTLSEADILRKAVGKKIKKLLDEQSEKFIKGLVNNGINIVTAEKMWRFIEPFARYGFNRSHAACYAMIAYQTAYLKTHYSGEFMASLLNAESFDLDRIAILMAEAKRMGIEILPPDINESLENFTLIKGEKLKIRFGLSAIKNLSGNAVESIIAQRRQSGNFTDLKSFLERMPLQDLNKKSLEALIKCGAMDSLADRQLLLSNIEELQRYGKDINKKSNSSQGGLFNSYDISAPLKLTPADPTSKKEKLAWEKEFLGLYTSEHPMQEYRELMEKKSLLIQKIKPSLIGQKVAIGGLISGIQKFVTKNGRLMLFTKLEDWANKIEVVVFPDMLERNPEIWVEEKIVMVQGRVSDRNGNLSIICDNVQELII